MLTLAPETTASPMPSGEVVDAQDLVSERFVSDIYGAGFIVEARSGNLLTRGPLLELHQNASALRADPDIEDTLFHYFDPAKGIEVVGIHTLADQTDAILRSFGVEGLESATEQEVSDAVALVLSEGAPSDWGLLSSASFDPATGEWTAPALIVNLVARNDALGGGGQAITLGSDDTTKEEFARDAQELLRGDESDIRVWGVAIDVNLTAGEQAAKAGPFIGFTILAVLVVAGLVLKSYWTVAVLGAALGALMIWLKGISNLIGLENDQVLSFIVPIAMISFGVDFAFHAVGRYREEAGSGYRPRPAFVIGMTGVISALVLALASDSVAFLSNVSSGIESIVQFGIAAAIALVAAFFVLGLVTPLVLMHIDDTIGDRPVTGLRRVRREIGSGLAAAGSMAVVLFLVYLLPAVGVALWAVYVLVFVVAPYAVVRRRSTTAERVSTPTQLRGAMIGRAAASIARRRRVVLPVVLVTWVAAVAVAVQIEPRFDVKDYFSADTDLVVSLDKLDEHVGQQGGEPADVLVEADLTRPGTLAALSEFVDQVRALDLPEIAVDDAGVTRVEDGVLGVVADVMGTPYAAGVIGAATGVALSDENGDGIPDTPDQIREIYGFADEYGIPFDQTRLVQTPDAVGMRLWQSEDGSRQATVLSVAVVGSRSQENVAAARNALEPLVDELQSTLQAEDAQARAVLTGSAIVRHEQLEAIMRALFVSLPISVLACLLLGAVFMRSVRLGVISIVPILVVVGWLYAFMHLAGYGINVVTATIGAVSIGIGIDFAIHFIMRYREEATRVSDQLEAVRAAGAGTGAALAASALSSVVGFAIMAFAPMPMFSAYGFLTAIMIVMAFVATLVVLPGLLMMTTRPPAVVPPSGRADAHASASL